MSAKGLERVDPYRVLKEPFYLPVGREVDLFEAAYACRRPVLLKGPTGCGKTRFVSHMAWRLKLPLITVACHEDLMASDLVGRYLLIGEETVWADGPLTLAARHGGICYLDEVVEARKDTTVVIHPLTDDRRILPLEKKGELIEAHSDFMLVISYNPGYQSVVKELKQSTKQRFIAIDFDYPSRDLESRILLHEAKVPDEIASRLVRLGEKIRNLKHHGLEEGVSTRLLIYAAQLISRGIPPRQACEAAITLPLSDDAEMQRAMKEIVSAFFEA
jgi:nitric oxide reductase NorQ protein